jgi:enolase
LTTLTIIQSVKARIIFNSRGEETVEVEVKTLGGSGRASAPAGKSKGKYEVAYFPPGGVREAVEKLRSTVEPRLVGLDADNQKLVDETLHEIDGTENFSRLGGNTAYAVSLASAQAAASTHGVPLFAQLAGETSNLRLPLPLGNVLGGGKHAGKGAPDFQEYLTVAEGCGSFRQAYEANLQVHRRLGKLLEERAPGFTRGKGDEGAWAPRLGNEEALEAVSKAAEEVSGEMGVKVRVGLDVAASSFWDSRSKVYRYESERRTLGREEHMDHVLRLIQEYRLAYVEDPLEEEDFQGFAELTEKAKGCLICGDDLFVTSREKLEEGIRLKAATAVIIKPNQVGTVSDALEAAKLARGSGLVPIASHRSGETCEGHLAHLAVAFGCPLIKAGVLGGERVAKMNELLRIEENYGRALPLASLKT